MKTFSRFLLLLLVIIAVPGLAYASWMYCTGFHTWLDSNCQPANGCYPSYQGGDGIAAIPVNDPNGLREADIHFHNTSCASNTCEYHVTEVDDYSNGTGRTTFLYNMVCDCRTGDCHQN